MKPASLAFQEFVGEQLEAISDLRFRRMFGGFGIYAGATFFGIIHRERLYFHTSTETQKRYEEAGTTCFVTPGRKKPLKRYYEVPFAIIEQKKKLLQWARESLESVSEKSAEAVAILPADGHRPMRAGKGTSTMHAFQNASVARVFTEYPEKVRARLMALRELIFATAARTAGVGVLEETLKWQQPSYLTLVSKSGSTIRIDALAGRTGDYAMYFHCQTSLVDTFKKRYGSLFRYEGSRALVFSLPDQIPKPELAECVAAALTYHLTKKR